MAIIESGQTVIYDDRTLRADSSTSGGRPGSPAVGTIFHNTTLDILEVWNGSAWKPQLSVTNLKPNAYGWGVNSFGQLGNGTTTTRSSPVSVVGGFTDWVQVSAGDQHTAAIRANGTAWAWGLNNTFGALGDGTTTSRLSPVSVVGGFTDWVQISAGDSFSVAIRANGIAYAWGSGADGRLGDNTTVSKSSPVSVVGGFTDWVQIDAGDNHATAIRSNGIAYAWGSNSVGQLGDNTTTGRSSPVSVVGGFTDWVQVNIGSNSYSTAIRANGTAWTWGLNSVGQLGDNTVVSKRSPVSVVGGFTDWVQISGATSSGGSHTIAIRG
jgi:alpha-tubulin suppressor-like RCC1 family protein